MVGVGDQPTAINRLGATDSAHPDTDRHGKVTQGASPVDGGNLASDPFGNRIRIVSRGVGHDDGEFFAAEAGNGIVGAKTITQRAGHPLKQFIAALMADGVVYPFEMVNIDHQ